MIPNCEGCKIEFLEAIKYQNEEGLYMATNVDELSDNIGHKGHFAMVMVNDNAIQRFCYNALINDVVFSDINIVWYLYAFIG